MNNGATIQAQHNLAHAGDIAKTVLMPGDPARASYITRNYLTDAVLVNDLRLMYAYTGLYKGERITVMAHGMGAPSAAIYAHELYACYDVDTIIRIGTAGALTGDLPLGSMVAASGACYNTSYCSQFGLNGVFSAVASYDVLRSLMETAQSHRAACRAGVVLSSDVYYCFDSASDLRWADMGVCAVEMETAALYIEAARTGKSAGALLTVTGNVASGEFLPANETNRVCGDMIRVALDTAHALAANGKTS